MFQGIQAQWARSSWGHQGLRHAGWPSGTSTFPGTSPLPCGHEESEGPDLGSCQAVPQLKCQGAGKTCVRVQPFQWLKGSSLGPQNCISPPPSYVPEECIGLEIPNTATQWCHLVLFRHGAMGSAGFPEPKEQNPPLPTASCSDRQEGTEFPKGERPNRLSCQHYSPGAPGRLTQGPLMGNRKTVRGLTPSCGRSCGERHLGECFLGGLLLVGVSSGVVRRVDWRSPCRLRSSKLGGPR